MHYLGVVPDGGTCDEDLFVLGDLLGLFQGFQVGCCWGQWGQWLIMQIIANWLVIIVINRHKPTLPPLPPIHQINTTSTLKLFLNNFLLNRQLAQLINKLRLVQNNKQLITISRSYIILVININNLFNFLFDIDIISVGDDVGVVDAWGWGCGLFVGFCWGLGEEGQDCVQVVLEKLPKYIEMYGVIEFEAVQPEYYGELVVAVYVQSVAVVRVGIVSVLVSNQLV